MQEITSEYVKGNINAIVLSSLLSGDKYGWQISKEIEERTEGKFVLKLSSLYSSLNRLEKQKMVDYYWKESDIGGTRKYYTLTSNGREEVEKNSNKWVFNKELIAGIFEVKDEDRIAPSRTPAILNFQDEKTTPPTLVIETANDETLFNLEEKAASVDEFLEEQNAAEEQRTKELIENITYFENNPVVKEKMEEVSSFISLDGLDGHDDVAKKIDTAFEETVFNANATKNIEDNVEEYVSPNGDTKITIINFDNTKSSAFEPAVIDDKAYAAYVDAHKGHNALSRLTIMDYNKDEDTHFAFGVEDLTDDEMDAVKELSVSRDADFKTFEVTGSDRTSFVIMATPKVSDAAFVDGYSGSYIYSPGSSGETKVIERENSTESDASFVSDYYEPAAFEEEINRQNEDYGKKYGEYILSESERLNEQGERIASYRDRNEHITLPGLDAYSVYSSSRYTTRTKLTNEAKKFINIHHINLIKNIILIVIAALEFIGVGILLSVKGLIDWQTAVALFISVYPCIMMMITAGYLYSYNRNKKELKKYSSPTVILEIIFSVLCATICYSINRLAGMVEWFSVPFSSYLFFPAIILVNVILGAIIYWILYSTSKYFATGRDIQLVKQVKTTPVIE